MCTSPILIKNPNYGYKGRYSFLKDCVSQYIPVPCGHCSECVHNRQMSITQRCLTETIEGYPFFCTLTYNNQSLPIYHCSDGYQIRYADLSDVVNMIKRIRKGNLFGRPFRYFAVSELGSKRGRPHFHLIFFVKRYSEDNIYTPLNLEKKLFSVVLSQWKRNIGSSRSPVYQPLCTYVCKYVCGKLKTTYDLHYILPSSLDGSSMDVPFYVTKYMLKPSDKSTRLQQALKLNLDELEYEKVWKTVRPRWFSSLNFGFGVYGLQPRKKIDRLFYIENSQAFKYVRTCVIRSVQSSDYPSFYNFENGRSMPLSRYWKSFGSLFTPEDVLSFYYKQPNQRADNVKFDERSQTSKDLADYRHIKQLSVIDNNIESLDLLFD